MEFHVVKYEEKYDRVKSVLCFFPSPSFSFWRCVHVYIRIQHWRRLARLVLGGQEGQEWQEGVTRCSSLQDSDTLCLSFWIQLSLHMLTHSTPRRSSLKVAYAAVVESGLECSLRLTLSPKPRGDETQRVGSIHHSTLVRYLAEAYAVRQ
ncbi:hypothetical protein BR93DRAFT_400579 [Coniochaeta sp. PMI_546]|nr:hypothetical protein BR93DRAFT_400579 [Coniochaeta sp. PMI_546]